jgi:hypothetical protein
MKPMASAMISDIGSPSRNHRGALRRADRSQAIAAHPHRMLTYPALEPGRRSIDCRHPLASRSPAETRSSRVEHCAQPRG